MANLYVNSVDGSDADNGTTWALAKATINGASLIDNAGDVIWVSDNHAESTAGALAWNWAGTAAGPTRVICGNDAAEPPTALATTATVATTGDNGMTFANGNDYMYWYGITFNCGETGTGTASIVFTSSAAHDVWESCNFHLASSGTSSVISFVTGTINAITAHCINCGFQFSATAQNCALSGGKATIKGGSVISDAAITEFVTLTNMSEIYIEGFDFTNCDGALNIVGSGGSSCRAVVRNCKMPASWSGSVFNGTPSSDAIYELYNCDDGDTNYRLEKKTEFGTITDETTLVRTGGATDGTTTISWEMVTTANAEWNHQTLDSPEIVRWNETTGSAITATIEILHDSATNMTDQGIWMEIQYLGTSGTPLALFADDAAADYITAAADQTTSSETWTTTGMANPNTQKLSVQFTPQEKGFIHAIVRVAAASKTVYIDPVITIS